MKPAIKPDAYNIPQEEQQPEHASAAKAAHEKWENIVESIN